MKSLKFVILICLPLLVFAKSDSLKTKPPPPDKNFPSKVWKNIWRDVVKENPNYVKDIKAQVEQHIVGGIQVPIEQYPWQVSMRINGQHICGGSLISNQWVVTAAHCSRYAVASTSFLMGTSNKTSAASGVVRLASSRSIHLSYNSGTLDYDVAVYKLNATVSLSGTKIKAIPLATSITTVDSGTNTTTSGWGSTETVSSPAMLRAVSIPALTNTLCSQLYNGGITDRMICAGFLEGGKDSCQGDSGGPLVATINNVNTLVGIVSWGTGCALPNYPGVYTRVSAIRSWIKTKTGV